MKLSRFTNSKNATCGLTTVVPKEFSILSVSVNTLSPKPLIRTNSFALPPRTSDFSPFLVDMYPFVSSLRSVV